MVKLQQTPLFVAHGNALKILIVIFFLIQLAPLGIILMWMLMKDWPKKIKWLLTIIFILGLLIITAMIIEGSRPDGHGGGG